MALNQMQDSNSIDSLLEMRRSDMGKNVARYVLIASLVNVVLGIVMSVALYRQYPQLVFYPLLLMVTAVTGWAYPRLYASGHKIIGPYLLIGSLILVAMAAPLLVPDLLIPVAIGFVLILMLGNLVLPERGTLSLVALIALAIVFDILAVKFWLPGRVAEIDPRVGASIAAVTSGVGVLGAALIMRQVIGDLFRQFIRIRQITHEIELQAAKEQERLLELSRTIDTYVAFLNQVSGGDLSACLEVNEEKALTDPLQRLGVNINATILNLKQMILQMQNTSTAVRGRAGEILLAMQSQAETATEQSAAIAQTASTVNEVRSIAEHVSMRAQEMAETSQRTVEVSRVGVRAVQDTIQGMTQIRERVDAIGSNTISLSERTKQIEAIIATVNALASQSNMLALNASIEAARAGEAGQGFAVVATEVRSLAIQSRKATEKIRSILTDIQKAVNATTMATEEGVKMVEVGTEMAAQGQDAIEQLTQAIEQSAQTAMQMLSGGRQQVAGMEQIAVAMKTINETTIQTVAVTRQTEHAVEGLSSLSAQMSDVVGNYRL